MDRQLDEMGEDRWIETVGLDGWRRLDEIVETVE